MAKPAIKDEEPSLMEIVNSLSPEWIEQKIVLCARCDAFGVQPCFHRGRRTFFQ